MMAGLFSLATAACADAVVLAGDPDLAERIGGRVEPGGAEASPGASSTTCRPIRVTASVVADGIALDADDGRSALVPTPSTARAVIDAWARSGVEGLEPPPTSTPSPRWALAVAAGLAGGIGASVRVDWVAGALGLGLGLRGLGPAPWASGGVERGAADLLFIAGWPLSIPPVSVAPEVAVGAAWLDARRSASPPSCAARGECPWVADGSRSSGLALRTQVGLRVNVALGPSLGVEAAGGLELTPVGGEATVPSWAEGLAEPDIHRLDGWPRTSGHLSVGLTWAPP